MQITDSFVVSLPLDEAWKVFLDVERIAPCMPGAQLQEVEGDTYRGIVKVKLGAITAQFKGTVRFTEVDEQAHRVVLRAEGKEVRGQGNAAATVTAVLEDADGGTRVSIDTDLSITGRVAQFGRGVMADVSHKLLGDFTRCLEADLSGGTQPAAAPPAPAAAPAAPQARTVQSAEPEPLDLLAIAGPSVMGRALPAALGVVLLLLAVTDSKVRRWVLALMGGALTAVLTQRRT